MEEKSKTKLIENICWLFCEGTPLLQLMT